MLIKNALVFSAGYKFQKQDVRFDSHVLEVGSVSGNPDIDADGFYLIPGLIDVHTHGAVNCDFSDGSAPGMDLMSRYYASFGVTSFCATTMTLPEDDLMKAMNCIRDFKRPVDGARCIGINLEGPFLSYAKRGAQAAENLHLPDAGLFDRLNEASDRMVRLVGIAPELPGAMDFISEVSKKCAVSVAHSAADYNTVMEAYRCGATQATHLFNAMNPLHHRDPAVVGAAFDSSVYAELICDGLHIHPAVIRIVFQLFKEKTLLISDSLRCSGMPDGNYELGGQPIIVKEGRATLQDGTLAGSCISLLKAVQNVISFGISPESAVCAATDAAAKAIGADSLLGSIEVGKFADMLILDKKFNLVTTIINGKVI